MITRLLGDTSPSRALREGMDRSTEELRGIAHRVANGATPGGDGFQAAMDEAMGVEGEASFSIEDEMINLADTQLRFEGAARMLQKVYQQVRGSVGGGGR